MAEELKLHFKKAGFFTSIQDFGRFGHQDIGIPISGAMDKESMQMANYLVGNSDDTPVIEITLLGPEIEIEGNGQIAFAGAQFAGKLNKSPLPLFETIEVKTGDTIKLKGTSAGCRIFLAVGGKTTEPAWLGSHSAPSDYVKHTGMVSHFSDGDTLTFHPHRLVDKRIIDEAKRPIYTSCTILRVVTGPDFEQFELEVIQEFFEKTFSISSDSNRMGYRLNEALAQYKAKGEEISSGVIPGTVQITGSGKPIILTADAQTTGGYPRIANVVTEDLDLVGQMKPGDELRFMLVSLEDIN